MKASIWERYGSPEALRLGEIDEPEPGPDEVLLKVRAGSVNVADWRSMRGKPLYSRATLGLWRPKHKILGVDVAGTVEAIGSGVTVFEPGDPSTDRLALLVRRDPGNHRIPGRRSR